MYVNKFSLAKRHRILITLLLLPATSMNRMFVTITLQQNVPRPTRYFWGPIIHEGARLFVLRRNEGRKEEGGKPVSCFKAADGRGQILAARRCRVRGQFLSQSHLPILKMSADTKIPCRFRNGVPFQKYSATLQNWANWPAQADW